MIAATTGVVARGNTHAHKGGERAKVRVCFFNIFNVIAKKMESPQANIYF